jgi:DNA-binding NarL/FixJ family response regulator
MIAERARQAGAHGFISKMQPVFELTTAIRKVLQGQSVFHLGDTLDATDEVDHARGFGNLMTDSLTNRELAIFSMIGKGLTIRQIANESGLAMKTIETHRDRIKAKLRLRNSVELLRLAVICSLTRDPHDENSRWSQPRP